MKRPDGAVELPRFKQRERDEASWKRKGRTHRRRLLQYPRTQKYHRQRAAWRKNKMSVEVQPDSCYSTAWN
jgi:hypothetical protein